MPRGVPKNGFRVTKKALQRRFDNSDIIDNDPQETDEEIDYRIRERFEVLEDLTRSTIKGDSRALIVSGPPGLGKSYTVETALANIPENDSTLMKGFCRATGIYRTLYSKKDKNQITVFDDIDSVFNLEDSLSLLKAACDTTERRVLSWGAETKMLLDDGDPIPTSFEYNGSIIFLTNKNFLRIIDEQQKLHEHISAMISRAHYVDLAMYTRRDYYIRIKQVVEQGMLSDRLTSSQIRQVMEFIRSNLPRLTEVSLRMAIKIASVMKGNPTKWEKICRITCMR